jgi:hypothetical protein
MSIVSDLNRYAVGGRGLGAGVRGRPLPSRPLVVTDATSTRRSDRAGHTRPGPAATRHTAPHTKRSGGCAVGACFSRPHSASPRLGTGISMQPCAVSRAATGTPRFSIQHCWAERPPSHALYHPAWRTGRFNPAPGAPPIAQRLRNCDRRNGQIWPPWPNPKRLQNWSLSPRTCPSNPRSVLGRTRGGYVIPPVRGVRAEYPFIRPVPPGRYAWPIRPPCRRSLSS